MSSDGCVRTKTTMADREASIRAWLDRQDTAAAEVGLSVIVPAYNEERRLPPTLIDMIDYLDARPWSYEIIVVDDGSRDETAEMARKFERIRKQIRVIRCPENRGKGYAVRTGMLNAGGRRVVFADADGSTPIGEVERLMAALDEGADIAIGSRAMTSPETAVKARWYRKFLGRIFNFCVNAVLLPGMHDTQCGFKMFRGEAAQFLVQRQQSAQFSFDIELLFLARRGGLKIAEVPVNWAHVPGSKVNLVLDSLKMFRDIFIFRWRHKGVTPRTYRNFLAGREVKM